jgi:PKD repeat protein
MTLSGILRGRGRKRQNPRPKVRLCLEPLETRVTPSSTYHLDFGPKGSPVAEGYTRAQPVSYTASKGYGWTAVQQLTAFQSKSWANALTIDGIRGTRGVFLADVPNGDYQVTVTLGELNKVRDNVSLWAEGILIDPDIDTSGTSFEVITFTVAVADGQLRLRIEDMGGANRYFSINGVDVVPTDPGDPVVNAGADQSGDEGGVVSFSGSSNPGGLSYVWDFGDGGSATGTLTPTHTYNDNGVYTVTLTATDAQGRSGSDTAIVTVNNVQPTATLTDDNPIDEGSPVTISFFNQADPSSVDVAAGFLYSYDFNNDGTWDVVDSTSANAIHTFTDNGNFVVRGRIKDKDGGSSVYTTTVAVDNVAPTATFGNNSPKNEGSAVTLSFSNQSDPSSADTTSGFLYSYDFNNDGTWDLVDSTSASANHAFADNGSFVVRGRIKDKDGGASVYNTTVQVNNVAPTATFSNNGPVTVGNPVTLSFSNQSDPSSADTSAGFRYSYDFNNDGAWDVTDSTTASADHTFSATGTYVVAGRIKDKDGGATNYTTTVTVGEDDGGDPPPLRTFYVSTTGSDSNPGSNSSPWRTLQYAANFVQAGDLVVVRSGTYLGFQITSDGTAAHPIAFKADPGVLVNGKHSATSAFAGAINLEGADYIIVDGFQVTLATYGETRANIRSVVNTGVIIRNNVIDNASWWGILTGGSENLLVENNRITNTQVQHGIYIANSADNPIVRGNYVTNSRGAGIQINADKDLPGDGIISNALVERNILLNNCRGESSSINLNGVEDSRIINNLIASQYRNGIAMYQDNQTAGTKRNLVANNTIVGSAWYGISISGAGSTNNRILNNILFSQSWASNFRGGLGVENITGLQSDYNILMGRVNRDPSNTENPSESPTQWRARGFDTNSLFLEEQYGTPSAALDALFVNPPSWPLYTPETGDYHLKAGSPAIDSALALAEVLVDLEGRVRGTTPDIGAYELGGSGGDSEAPSIAVTSPADGATVSGIVTLTATASDNIAVASVRFYVDNVQVGPTLTSAPYTYNWDSETVSNGSHTIIAKAWDAAGNVGTSSTITITVTNANAGLVAAFGFNEGSGSNLGDSSGKGNNGTISGATWTTGGKFGGGLSFDGLNDLVTIADSNTLDLSTGMTLEAWVKPSSVGDWSSILLKESSNGLAYGMYASDDASKPAGYINTGGSDQNATGGSALPLNAWTHLAVTFDGATLKLFVNGNLAGSKAVSGSIITTTGALRIGGNSVWGEYFAGIIDEVRIYKRALTQTEIQDDMNRAV